MKPMWSQQTYTPTMHVSVVLPRSSPKSRFFFHCVCPRSSVVARALWLWGLRLLCCFLWPGLPVCQRFPRTSPPHIWLQTVVCGGWNQSTPTGKWITVYSFPWAIHLRCAILWWYQLCSSTKSTAAGPTSRPIPSFWAQTMDSKAWPRPHFRLSPHLSTVRPSPLPGPFYPKCNA